MRTLCGSVNHSKQREIVEVVVSGRPVCAKKVFHKMSPEVRVMKLDSRRSVIGRSKLPITEVPKGESRFHARLRGFTGGGVGEEAGDCSQCCCFSGGNH